ncbi:hypothetical protein [Pantoea sp. Taur]|uniref:hypothetical protein n=1 Tax=Pantoea sp. Taur TaxID=2576757 RepID=UPI0013529A44|nr:hypothetical protein [Pantoea sp. Taur]MXP59550.1 hypothetical protein [Pantoea sp. Taur]
MKDYIIKKALPDGKVSITLFADIETANEIARIAKENAIDVIDAGEQLNINEPTKVKKSLAEVLQTINALGESAQIKLDKKAKEESELNTDPIAKIVKLFKENQ